MCRTHNALTKLFFIQINLLHHWWHQKGESLSVEVIQHVPHKHWDEYNRAVISITSCSHDCSCEIINKYKQKMSNKIIFKKRLQYQGQKVCWMKIFQLWKPVFSWWNFTNFQKLIQRSYSIHLTSKEGIFSSPGSLKLHGRHAASLRPAFTDDLPEKHLRVSSLFSLCAQLALKLVCIQTHPSKNKASAQFRHKQIIPDWSSMKRLSTLSTDLCSLNAIDLLEWPWCLGGGFEQRYEFETWCRCQGNVSCKNAKTPDKNNVKHACFTLQVDTCTLIARTDEPDDCCVNNNNNNKAIKEICLIWPWHRERARTGTRTRI